MGRGQDGETMTPEQAYEIVEAFIADHWPKDVHAGSCGPWTDCDATCPEKAALAEAMHVVRAALTHV